MHYEFNLVNAINVTSQVPADSVRISRSSHLNELAHRSAVFCTRFSPSECLVAARANARLGEDREHGLECWQAVGMFPCVSLRCLIAKIRDFQGC